MAPHITSSQSHALYDFLGSHQKLHFLLAYIDSCIRATELKIDHGSFKLMRNEKVIAKRLGKAYSKGNDLEPFTAREDQAMKQLKQRELNKTSKQAN